MSGADVNRDRVTISEAATLLGVHPNTVRKRVKDGTYDAEKVVTENGPTWLIDRESLANNPGNRTLPSTSQQLVNTVSGVDLDRRLTELVEAIKGDPQREEERENRLEAVKLRTRALQTQIVATAGLIIAFGAVRSAMTEPQAEGFLIAAFALMAAAAVFAFIYMHHLAGTIAENIERPAERSVRAVERLYYVSTLIGIGAGVASFLLFLYQNPP